MHMHIAYNYHFMIGTVDTPSLQGRIAARGDAEKVVSVCVCVCVCVRACMRVLKQVAALNTNKFDDFK